MIKFCIITLWKKKLHYHLFLLQIAPIYWLDFWYDTIVHEPPYPIQYSDEYIPVLSNFKRTWLKFSLLIQIIASLWELLLDASNDLIHDMDQSSLTILSNIVINKYDDVEKTLNVDYPKIIILRTHMAKPFLLI